MKTKFKFMALTLLLGASFGATIKAVADRKKEGTNPGGITVKAADHREKAEVNFSGATGWLNTSPLTAAGLRGKVVVVEFWTYTCINWRRTLPYVRAWAERYKNQGLVVIGVSTPEFAFEKSVENVRRATAEMKMDFPVALDNNYAIWNAFGNQYWPALYFIDAKGQIRHHQFGEGSYEQSEKVIQQLLTEAGAKGVPADLSTVEPSGVELAADGKTLRSGETYTGYGRTDNFASQGDPVYDKPHVFVAPARLELNQWTLSGEWTFGKEAALLNRPGGRIIYRFHARDVNLILGPAKPGTAIRFRVSIDGKAPGAAHGVDVDAGGNGTMTGQGMYQLIRQPAPIKDREFAIEFADAGVEAFDFTFG